MPPKKKGNKKANDDWEAEAFGETPAAAAAGDAPAGADAPAAEDEAPAGGLMARMKKMKEKRKQKGMDEDWLNEVDTAPEGAASPAAAADEHPAAAPAAPVEASMEDEFALPAKKGGKQQKGVTQVSKAKQAAMAAEKKEEEELAEGERVLTKAEKEKLKKEREKQRKKEQVCFCSTKSEGE